MSTYEELRYPLESIYLDEGWYSTQKLKDLLEANRKLNAKVAAFKDQTFKANYDEEDLAKGDE